MNYLGNACMCVFVSVWSSFDVQRVCFVGIIRIWTLECEAHALRSLTKKDKVKTDALDSARKVSFFGFKFIGTDVGPAVGPKAAADYEYHFWIERCAFLVQSYKTGNAALFEQLVKEYQHASPAFAMLTKAPASSSPGFYQ